MVNLMMLKGRVNFRWYNAGMKIASGLVCLFLLVGCSSVNIIPSPTLIATRSGQLQAYLTPTSLRTATPARDLPTATPLPTPTITPRLHVVKLGEDMSGIALRYRVSLEALKTANPSANPRIIIVGQQIIIPAGTPIPGTAVPTATQTKLIVDPPTCRKDESGGLWCFSAVKNLQTAAVESVTLRYRLLDDKGKQAAVQVTGTILNLIQSGQQVPAGVYFPSPLPQGFHVGADLVNVLPVQNGTARYLPVTIENQSVQVAGDQLSAEIKGNLVLSIAPPNARQVWVAAAAYAADGSLVGVRRWESPKELGSTPLPFSFLLYSVSEKIARVNVMAEARP